VEATRTSSDGGFTLIELMIVIVVLRLVAATVLFAASGVSDRGTASVCKANLRQIKGAGEAYFTQVGETRRFPNWWRGVSCVKCPPAPTTRSPSTSRPEMSRARPPVRHSEFSP
jgi:prepilin-type N-terminal cleavage/methylation domain-containing protein